MKIIIFIITYLPEAPTTIKTHFEKLKFDLTSLKMWKFPISNKIMKVLVNFKLIRVGKLAIEWQGPN